MKGLLKRLRGQPHSKPLQFLIAPSQVRMIEAQFDHAPRSAVRPTVVSFGTRDGIYDAYARRLGESCDAAGMPASIETIPACPPDNAFLFKPTFIKVKLLTLGGPVIWLDADAVVSEPLQLPVGEWDVGTLPNNLPEPINPKSALCIAFNPTIAALRFLEHWEQLCAAHWLKPGHDHRRFNYTREILGGHYMEVDLSDAVRGRLVRDAGRRKEAAF